MRRYFKIKKIFLELVLTYLFIIMIPTILAVLTSITAKNISLKREIERYTASLEQGMNLFEKQLQEFDRQAQQYMYSYELNIILKQEVNEARDQGIYHAIKFQKDLQKKFSNALIRDNYCILLENGITFNSTTMCHDFEFFYKYFRNYEKLSYQEYIDLSFKTRERILFPMQKIKLNDTSIEAMTYSYPISRVPQQKNHSAQAVIQFLMAKEYVQSLFASVIADHNISMYILDEDSNILVNIGKYQDIALSLKDERGHFLLEDDYLAIYIKSDETKYSYLSVIPQEIALKDVLDLQQMLVFWIIILGIIDIGLGVFFAWKYSLPLKNLVKNIEYLIMPMEETQTTLNVANVTNEYEYLQKSFQKLVMDNRSIKANSFYYHLFLGEFKNNNDVINEAAKVGIQLGKLNYCIACGEMDQGDSVAYNYLIGGKEEAVLGVQKIGKILFILFGYDVDKEDEYIYSNIERVGKNICATTKSVIHIGVGLIYRNETEITFSYNQAGIALAYSQNDGEEKKCRVVRYTALPLDQYRVFYPSDLSEKLINYTRQGEENALKELLDLLEEENFKKRKLSVAMQKLLVANSISTMLKLTDDDRGIDIIQFSDETLCCKDSKEAMKRIKRKFMDMCIQNKKVKMNRRHIYHSMLCEYLEQHYMDTQLTLGEMAREFAFSEGYFSQFFKENMGDVFSNHLEKLRIQKAKELLKIKKYTIERVAEKVGYNSSATFRRAFKKVTGVSPSNWNEI